MAFGVSAKTMAINEKVLTNNEQPRGTEMRLPGLFWLVLAATGMIAYFWFGLTSLSEAWAQPEYSHGPLIPLIAGFLLLREVSSRLSRRAEEWRRSAWTYCRDRWIAGWAGRQSGSYPRCCYLRLSFGSGGIYLNYKWYWSRNTPMVQLDLSGIYAANAKFYILAIINSPSVTVI